MVLLAHMREQHHLSLGSYGRPRMTQELKELAFKVSMRGRCNCYDNAAVETFFKTLRAELVW
jgi:putative transposase